VEWVVTVREYGQHEGTSNRQLFAAGETNNWGLNWGMLFLQQ
jgi:hypothetical protein